MPTSGRKEASKDEDTSVWGIQELLYNPCRICELSWLWGTAATSSLADPKRGSACCSSLPSLPLPHTMNPPSSSIDKKSYAVVAQSANEAAPPAYEAEDLGTLIVQTERLTVQPVRALAQQS